MRFQYVPYIMDVDVMRTKAYYEKNAEMIAMDACDCAGCENYRNYVEQHGVLLKRVLEPLGITDLKAVAESSAFYTEEDGEVIYDIWYHVCGTLVSGTTQEGAYPISDTLELWVNSQCDLLPEDFPQPAIQINIMGKIPWLLERKNPYET